jgi:hypothetical protein
MSVVLFNSARIQGSTVSRRAISLRVSNLSAAFDRWKGSNLGKKTRSNLSVDSGYHVGCSPVYLSSQIANKDCRNKKSMQNSESKIVIQPWIFSRLPNQSQTVRGVPFKGRSTRSSMWLDKATKRSKNNLPPISISICMVPLRLKVFRLRIIRAK